MHALQLRIFLLASAALLAGCGSGGSSGPGDDGGGGGGDDVIAAYDLLFTDGENLCGMNADGSGKAVLKQATEFDAYDYFAQMAVSPDGTKIVYAAACAGSRFLRVMGSDLGDPTDLTPRCGPDAAWPAFSPDGARIAFIATYWTEEEKGAYLYLMNADGTGAHRVAPLDGIYDPGDRGPAFTRDGSRILFTRGSEVWSIALDGSDAAVEVADGGYATDPVSLWVTVDAGGGEAYYVAAQVDVLDNTPNVYRLSDGALLTDEPDHAIERPTVSPDGQKLVFSRVFDFYTQDLQVLDLSTGSAVTISAPSFSEFNADPVFVPKP